MDNLTKSNSGNMRIICRAFMIDKGFICYQHGLSCTTPYLLKRLFGYVITYILQLKVHITNIGYEIIYFFIFKKFKKSLNIPNCVKSTARRTLYRLGIVGCLWKDAFWNNKTTLRNNDFFQHLWIRQKSPNLTHNL